MTPIDVQLESIARDAVKMFEGEAKAADVDLVLRIEESCKQGNVNNISLDPTRVLQVLIVSCPPCSYQCTVTNKAEPPYKCNQIYSTRKDAPDFSWARHIIRTTTV
jgi:hypothetical protein